VTHHKSTLLIASQFSFMNAGSGSNQSNHMYKLGPIHQGIMERGAKTSSDSYILWPARIGAFSLCYGWIGFSLEIDQTFIGAILTVIGYDINDSVVVFDRIRENLRKRKGLLSKTDEQKLFNDSINETLSRTINTSLSTLIVLLAIFILGGDSIRSFTFAMIIGVVIGTLSSIFIASPVAYLVMGKNIRNRSVEAETDVAKA